MPSSVSAIKVDGKRAYARVRDGEDVELGPPVAVTISRGRREGSSGVTATHSTSSCASRCSSGTYVRAMARDVGAALGVGGHLTALRRGSVGPFTLDDAPDTDLDHLIRDVDR